ncbi:MAG: ribosomal L7Ae/L30e/S12e/Gadd45 family protein [Clostridia bacterium]|nr:ribosomal L7Ae/L30e/S12e/Gadd45 family protein [Clostridia bacterium]
METINEKKVVGLKQTIRAIESGEARLVYIAEDCDMKLKEKIREIATKKKVKVVMVPTMEELGEASGVKVGSATVAILN